MMLDERGDLSIATIAFYIPVFCATLFLVFQHGLSREGGWFFLLIFSSIRIVGGAVHISVEKIAHPSIARVITAFALESAGVAPLLICTLSFIAIVGKRSLSGLVVASPYVFHLIRLVIGTSFAVSIAGAAKAPSSNAGDRNQAAVLRKVGSILLVSALALIMALYAVYWILRGRIGRNHKKILTGISFAVPFLIVRMVYQCLVAFGPLFSFGPPIPGAPAPIHNSISKFNLLTGKWQLFLVMSLLMEYIVALIYLVVGALVPFDEELNGATGHAEDGLSDVNEAKRKSSPQV